MRNTIFLLILTVLLAIPGIAYGKTVINDNLKPQYLFVLSTKSGTVNENKITFKEVPGVIYFSDRPDRIAGHMSLKEFVELWSKGSDSFKVNPPNATLACCDKSGGEDVVVELIETPVINGDSITFKVKPLSGTLPEEFTYSSLFIDQVVQTFPYTEDSP